ncbi:unnamed protein product [Brachionus calyciflorus]|uniref:NEDD8 ultimate buster 1 n=1 Tax=Brachionus calyciflorus TaxID=104777 RepID=A0A814EF64_9BILA|nr:unnamed protein product [Brachionus calyciflorus]
MEINNNDQEEEETCLEKFLNSDKCLMIVNLLTKLKIKLWELPDLTLPESHTEFDSLLMKLSDESGLIEFELKEILIKLQKHSIKKLEENKKYQKDGSCFFRVKIIGNLNHSLSSQNLETNINQTGLELKKLIMTKYNLNCDSLKLICNGKVIKEDLVLFQQEIKNHSTLMAICVYEKVLKNLAEDTKEAKMISDIKDAVNLLTCEKIKNYENFNRGLKLQNQNGVTLNLSENDERCLTTAMILHEKSKILMKKKNFLKSVILLAEADNEFKGCEDKSLLERVDNYALLNMDIIWCYLNMENLNDLKNAEERLKICEECLKKCYGFDLSRLNSIKSETVNKHTPIFVRLNLLKAILNYHKGKRKECKEFLDMASRDLKKISVDDDKITQIMSMGFSSTEAKLALRATFNNVDSAIEQIFKKKRTLEEAKLLEKQKKLEEKYGRCLTTNQPIDAKILNDIVRFGYSEQSAARALIRANNDFNIALDLLQDVESEKEDDKYDEILSQLISMGFDLETCKLCLKTIGPNLQKSIEFLTQNKNESLELFKQKLEEIQPSCSKQTEELRQNLSKAIDAQKLLSNLAGEIPEDDEAYLDLNTDDDLYFINKYYSLLEA